MARTIKPKAVTQPVTATKPEPETEAPKRTRKPRPKKIHLKYVGEKPHTISFPGGHIRDNFKVVFDDNAEATVDEATWEAIAPHAANAGIFKI